MSEPAMANGPLRLDALAGIYAQIAVEGLSALVDLHPDEVARRSAHQKLRESMVTFAVARGLSDRTRIFAEIGRALLGVQDL